MGWQCWLWPVWDVSSTYGVTSTWQPHSGLLVQLSYCYCHRLYIYYMCAGWPYFYSTCMYVQLFIFLIWRYYFMETSPNKILPLPHMPFLFMRGVYRDVLIVRTTYPVSVGYFSIILFIYIIYISFLFDFFYPISTKVEILHLLCSAFIRSNSAISFISSYFTFL